MLTQKFLYEALKAEAIEAAQKVAGASMVNDYKAGRQWATYFDSISGYAIAIKGMSREEFATFLAWNAWAREVLFGEAVNG